MEVLTVKQLLTLCNEEVRAGNGDKKIMLSSDEEGNEFHDLYQGFTSVASIAKYLRDYQLHDCTLKEAVENYLILG